MQVALAFPAGKRRRRADGGFLQDLQAVTQPTGKPARQQQMTVMARKRMGNVDVDILDLGVEQLPLAGQDAHTGFFDKHFTGHLAHMGPARLERQLGVMHLEEQADIARRRHRIVVQRTLILEEAFIDRALENGRTQPFIQGRAQHGR